MDATIKGYMEQTQNHLSVTCNLGLNGDNVVARVSYNVVQ